MSTKIALTNEQKMLIAHRIINAATIKLNQKYKVKLNKFKIKIEKTDNSGSNYPYLFVYTSYSQAPPCKIIYPDNDQMVFDAICKAGLPKVKKGKNEITVNSDGYVQLNCNEKSPVFKAMLKKLVTAKAKRTKSREIQNRAARKEMDNLVKEVRSHLVWFKEELPFLLEFGLGDVTVQDFVNNALKHLKL